MKILVDIPSSVGIVMELYSVFSTFSICPPVQDLMDMVITDILNPYVVDTIVLEYTSEYNWLPEEQSIAANALINFQQSLTRCLHTLGYPTIKELELLRVIKYKLILMITT